MKTKTNPSSFLAFSASLLSASDMVTLTSGSGISVASIQAESITIKTCAKSKFDESVSATAAQDSTNTDRDLKLELKFQELSQKWRRETSGLSSMSQMISNKHYLRVIALGKEVIPCILKQLRTQSVPWFAALRALTEREDIGKANAGNFRKIADAWIDWGKQEGYI